MINLRDTPAPVQLPFGGFVPLHAPARAALVCYGIVSLVFWTLLVRKPPRYMVVMCIGSTAMTLGFAFREVFIADPYSQGRFLAQNLLILLSPCFFLATDYMIFSRLAVSLTTPAAPVSGTCLVIPATRVAKIFVGADITTLLIQAAGGAMLTQVAHASLGKKIVLVGLVIQLITFGAFTGILAVFGLRVRKRFPGVWNISSGGGLGRKDWRVLFWMIALTCVGILIRSVFRIIEFSQGFNGYISTHEVYFYCFDSLPLLVAIGLYAFVWPPAYTHPHQERRGMRKVGGEDEPGLESHAMQVHA